MLKNYFQQLSEFLKRLSQSPLGEGGGGGWCENCLKHNRKVEDSPKFAAGNCLLTNMFYLAALILLNPEIAIYIANHHKELSEKVFPGRLLSYCIWSVCKVAYSSEIHFSFFTWGRDLQYSKVI